MKKKLEDHIYWQAFIRGLITIGLPLLLSTNFVKNAPHLLRMDPSTPNQGRVRSSRSMAKSTPNPRDDQRARCQKAARELLLQKHKNAREAGDANDCVEWRQVSYWANKWKKDGTMDSLVKATRVIEQDAAMDISAKKRKKKEENASDGKLEYGQDGHWPAYTEAYKQAGHLVRKGLTPGKAALRVSGQFGVKMSRQTAMRASSTVDKSRSCIARPCGP